jgi:hypothetical protein
MERIDKGVNLAYIERLTLSSQIFNDIQKRATGIG